MLKNISIILIRPVSVGNMGAVARVMANFGFEDLVIINPIKSPTSSEALNRACHAKDILKKAKIKDFDYLKKFHTLVGTVSKLGTDYNISRSPIKPEQLAEKINVDKKIGLVFGKEDTGLTNEQIKMCDFIVTIPTSKQYPAMNLSHAVSVMLYELSKKYLKDNVSSHIIISSKKEKDQLEKMINDILDNMEFETESKRETQRKIWKRILGKSFLTKREAYALMGFFDKIGGSK